MFREDELASASATGNTERVGILLQTGTDVNAVNRFGRTPLQVMMMGSTAVARLLLEHGANPNVSDSHTGATPLHDAARGGFLETVAILIQYQADVNARDYNDRRPIDLARTNGHLDVVAFLESL
ncbi:cyclin-dependent kinase 4 inhibitor B-like [Megalops cyprinoides]|uniref:cyclin-dependent kinase 4 inhibitor B-like n=1 Tax=Megalops cyprinoides TaxID=118141 RepID=UPI0018650475|nr:cyclin-dependent kinase 4 inhibitor B-like [Megalops cyprinoides]